MWDGLLKIARGGEGVRIFEKKQKKERKNKARRLVS